MSVTQSDRGKTGSHLSRQVQSLPTQEPIPPNWGSKRRIWVIPLFLVLAVVPLALGWKILMNDNTGTSDTLVYYTVRRGTLPISVTERGNLESQKTEEIICEVENFGGDRSGTTGTQILYIVPNGSSVKKGDLLVELDAAPLQERLDSQFLALQRAEAEKIQANSKYDNQITQNETNLEDARLKVELAKLDMESYEDETGGTFQIELQNIEMEIQTARAQRMISEADQEAIEQLYKLGYKSRGDFEAAKLALLKANSTLAGQLARAQQLTDYTYKMETLDRKGKHDTAKRMLEQVGRNNESELAQAEAARDSADRAYEKEQERYDRYKEQLEMCKIYAPQDGMVAYAVNADRHGGGTMIEEGAFVRQRQQILTIPDLTRMQVNTAVHESVLDQVHQDLRALIRVDAFPERSYHGSVKTVAVLPDQGGWMSSDTKVYKTIVTIDEDVKQLKPGMTAVVEIDIEQLPNVISVPIQAIIQRGNANWCYVKQQGKLDRREVTLGKTNEKFVEVKAGLADGEVVVLNPMSLVDEEAASKSKADKEKEEEDAAANEDDATEAVPSDRPAADETPADRAADVTAEKEPGPGRGGGPQGKMRPAGRRGGFDFDTLDKNQDGQVTKEEMPGTMFERFDKNGDGIIERSEIPSLPNKK